VERGQSQNEQRSHLLSGIASGRHQQTWIVCVDPLHCWKICRHKIFI